MRKLILFAVVFLLLAAPAWAADVDVDIDVSAVDKMTVTCEGPVGDEIDFVVAIDAFTNGYCYEADSFDYTQCVVKSNHTWNLTVKHDAPTGWAATTWSLRVLEGGNPNSNGSDGMAITATAANYFTGNQGATNGKTLKFYYMIDDIEWEDTWIAAIDMKVTWTLVAGI